MDREKISSVLIDLGYLKYTSSLHSDEVLTIVIDSILEHRELYTSFYSKGYDSLIVAKDHRYIYCDYENLSEFLGKEACEVIRYSFIKLDLPFIYEYIGHTYDENDEYSTMTYLINNRIYKLRQKGINYFAYDFAIMINCELTQLKSLEKLYLITPGNDGGFIFLDKNLSDFICNNLNLRSSFTPMLPELWGDKYLVD